MTFKTRITPEQIEDVKTFLLSECVGIENKTSRDYISWYFFNAPPPILQDKQVTFIRKSIPDRKTRDVIAYLQNHGVLVVYDSESKNGGLFVSKEPADCVPYINKEYAKLTSMKDKLSALYHSYKSKYGEDEAAKLGDGQMELELE